MTRLRTCVGIILSFLTWTRGSRIDGLLSESEVPETGEEWISLSEETEFLPASSDSNTALRRAQRRFLGYTDSFADGSTYYDEYSQAWRVLGWYIDCTTSQDKRRRLDEAGDDSNANVNENLSCKRYLLWAAYVDLGYQGGGIGEYQIFNTNTGEWDTSACAARKGKRCALMDCHLPTSHFKLLGYFKQYDYNDFFEQLFKHEAYCIWSESEYEFMQTYRDWWPEGCTNTGATSGSNSIYMDIKPQSSGDMGLGLYVDSGCTHSYSGRSVTLESLVDSNEGSSLDAIIAEWNKDFGAFKVCQPCKAYDLSVTSSDGGNQDDANGGLFACNDKAGYENVNQCMKFRTQTNMVKASYKDIELASRQGSITPTYANDVSQSFLASWGFFTLSAIIFVVGLLFCILSAKPKRRKRSIMPILSSSNKSKPNSEPLLSSMSTKSSSGRLSSGRLSPSSTRSAKS